MKTGNLWDIFCTVIDNYGDIGVCWRLSADLAARGERVRLWVDDASALRWMTPDGAPGVQVMAWTQSTEFGNLTPGDILVEAFGCHVAPEFLAAFASGKKAGLQTGKWINLEYLSAEGFVERCHGLPSPVMTGPAVGLTKHFFYPGFTAGTGGLLREPDLAQRQSRFDRVAWLQRLGIEFHDERLISLFCYEPATLGELLNQLAAEHQPTHLLVTSGRAAAAVKSIVASRAQSDPAWNLHAKLSFSFLPALSQVDFDHLLWACDLNFVRGEDSLVRALWAKKPFVWQIYPQSDDAHLAKLDAFLQLLNAPPSLREFHQVWNGASDSVLPPLELAPWQQGVGQLHNQLMKQHDLVTQIIRFVLKNH
ncbi:MAG: elongation factor P maturation arginine rhamnosyltransferase EarP [Comamonadaceae bacterium]